MLLLPVVLMMFLGSVDGDDDEVLTLCTFCMIYTVGQKKTLPLLFLL